LRPLRDFCGFALKKHNPSLYHFFAQKLLSRPKPQRRYSADHSVLSTFYHAVFYLRLNPQYKTKKQTVFEKISAFVEKFKGVGGQV